MAIPDYRDKKGRRLTRPKPRAKCHVNGQVTIDSGDGCKVTYDHYQIYDTYAICFSFVNVKNPSVTGNFFESNTVDCVLAPIIINDNPIYDSRGGLRCFILEKFTQKYCTMTLL